MLQIVMAQKICSKFFKFQTINCSAGISLIHVHIYVGNFYISNNYDLKFKVLSSKFLVSINLVKILMRQYCGQWKSHYFWNKFHSLHCISRISAVLLYVKNMYVLLFTVFMIFFLYLFWTGRVLLIKTSLNTKSDCAQA